MRTTLKRGLAGLMAVSAVATVAPILAASPAAALATDNVAAGGTINVTGNTSGGATTTFGMSLTETGGVSPTCPGDGPAGYRWSTFIIPSSSPVSGLVFAPSGAVNAVAGEFRNNLYQGTTAVRGRNPDLTSATISGIPGMQYNIYASTIPAGTYQVGIACHTTGGTLNDVYDYWAKTVTISQTGGVMSWAVGATPSAPVFGTITPDDGQLTVAFTQPTADPAVTGFTLSATPQGGGATVTATGATSPLTLTGLTNGTTYDLSLTSTNPAGTSPAATATGVPNKPALAAPTVTATPTVNGTSLSWAGAGGTPTGYTVTLSPDPTGGPFSQTVTGTTLDITGLTAGTSYTATVTALYADPTDVGTPGTASVIPLSDGVLVQNIVATRPVGALVLTQDCQSDPTCTVDLGTGALAASGTYYTATGTLYELTVTDTRDTDLGWSVTGDIADTFTTTGDSFDSRALGWAPFVTFDAPASPSGYDPTIAPGATIAPNSSEDIMTGVAQLFSAPAGAGLGIARASANLTLQIPVSAVAGTYSAQLAISVA